MGVGRDFMIGCIDIVERGRLKEIEITKVSIEGVYMGEIFSYSYEPKEEGYDGESEQAEGA